MKRLRQAGVFLGLLLVFSGGLAIGQPPAHGSRQLPLQAPAQPAPAVTSELPATPATAAAGPASSPAAPAVTNPLSPADRLPPHRAVVVYANGRLSVEANNSSLNQILWAIGQWMGMKITGGVQDERVYGSYGPADPATVLSALIDGTGSNMLLKTGSQGTSELVLTPRGGGPAPPSPGPGPDVADLPREDLPPQPTRSRPTDANTAGVPAPSVTTPSAPPVLLPAVVPAAASPVTTPAATTTQASPNGVGTPQQVFQQLLKLQQAASKPAAMTTPAATTPAAKTTPPPQP